MDFVTKFIQSGCLIYTTGSSLIRIESNKITTREFFLGVLDNGVCNIDPLHSLLFSIYGQGQKKFLPVL